MSLSAQQVKGIASLLSSKTIAEAARKTGVDESTMRRWLSQQEFTAEYSKELRGVMAVVTGRLKSASVHAIKVLETLMRDKKTEPKVRVSAASKILELASRGHQFEQLRSDGKADDDDELEGMSTEEMERSLQ